MADYTPIISRLEKADRADRELDVFVYAAVYGWELAYNRNNLLIADTGKFRECIGTIDPGKHQRNFSTGRDDIPRYTDSLDATIALCERMLAECDLRVEKWCGEYLASAEYVASADGDDLIFAGSGKGATPAIALLLALFRALQEQESD
ncbi:hypothetical protein [Oricola sp.]|uniref:hypothetical protein n=1 Tax=Oricola sp. TaxID=1979950 RepID=UPI003BACE01D